MKKKQMPVHLTEPQQEFLAAESERLGISRADVIRRLLDQVRGAVAPPQQQKDAAQ